MKDNSNSDVLLILSWQFSTTGRQETVYYKFQFVGLHPASLYNRN